jgi:tRNA (guanine6-N2)-methyltransferase
VGAIRNARAAGVADTVKFLQGDATKLEGVEADIVVTNPPYGLRIGSKRIIEELYSGFLASLQNVLNDNGTAVIITSNDKILRKYAEALGYKIEEKIEVKYGNLDTAVFKLHLQ